ncbi:MAG: prepilin-type N-terminal cleavage/methylation domain-containing protein [Candidatus Omnitrophica bacterium]|nr:prepilin-type N-terminal cleavage/methylation domain-containing protein [Candidatus Omnitrophota bacterium]
MKVNLARGFTLVEVIIAALLLTTVGAVLFVAFTSAHRWTQPQNSTAFSLARQTAENLYPAVRQSTWTSSGNPLSAGYDSSAAPETVVLDANSYQRSYKVKAVSPAGGTAKDYRKAEVTVSWPSS